LTRHIGANAMLLAVRVDLADAFTSTDVEQILVEIDLEIHRPPSCRS
jgi:hypothetical protein